MKHSRQLSTAPFALWLSFCLVVPSGDPELPRPGVRDWKYYGGDPEGTRFSALTQINRSNVSQLKIAWTYRTGEQRYSSPKMANVLNPRTSPEDISSGQKLFQSVCVTCHTTGGRGPDLSHHELKYGKTDAALFRTIFDGIPNSAMPGLYESEDTVWRVVAYVRSLLPSRENETPREDRNQRPSVGWKQEARYSVMECTPIVA